MTSDATAPALARRLTTRDAVFIGAGSMVGAGLFTVFAPAAAAAGSWLLAALAVAVPVGSLVAGLGVLAVGVTGRLVALRLRARS